MSYNNFTLEAQTFYSVIILTHIVNAMYRYATIRFLHVKNQIANSHHQACDVRLTYASVKFPNNSKLTQTHFESNYVCTISISPIQWALELTSMNC